MTITGYLRGIKFWPKLLMLTNKDKHFMGIKDIFCLLLLGVCPSERFLDPPPGNFLVYDFGLPPGHVQN